MHSSSATPVLSALSPYSHLLPDLRSFLPTLIHYCYAQPRPFSPTALVGYYTSAPAIHGAIVFCMFNCAWTWFFAELTGNASMVDKVWTFLPVLYNAHFTLHPFLTSLLQLGNSCSFSNAVHLAIEHINPRSLLVLFLTMCWSARLSYNTFRRGLFNWKDEDYRWPVLRQRLSTFQFKLLNIFFIAIAQNILLAMMSLPVYFLSTLPASLPLGTEDAVVAMLYLVNLAHEYEADNQQWKFQEMKRMHLKNPNLCPLSVLDKAAVQRGFVTSGLWAWSRHPNFMSEQLGWWLLCLFPLIAVHTFPDTTVAHPSSLPLYPFASAIAYSALFYASSAFSEGLSQQKYPAYVSYQKRVARFAHPVTLLKAVYRQLTGEKERLDQAVWGNTFASVVKKGEKDL